MNECEEPRRAICAAPRNLFGCRRGSVYSVQQLELRVRVEYLSGAELPVEHAIIAQCSSSRQRCKTISRGNPSVLMFVLARSPPSVDCDVSTRVKTCLKGIFEACRRDARERVRQQKPTMVQQQCLLLVFVLLMLCSTIIDAQVQQMDKSKQKGNRKNPSARKMEKDKSAHEKDVASNKDKNKNKNKSNKLATTIPSMTPKTLKPTPKPSRKPSLRPRSLFPTTAPAVTTLEPSSLLTASDAPSDLPSLTPVTPAPISVKPTGVEVDPTSPPLTQEPTTIPLPTLEPTPEVARPVVPPTATNESTLGPSSATSSLFRFPLPLMELVFERTSNSDQPLPVDALAGSIHSFLSTFWAAERDSFVNLTTYTTEHGFDRLSVRGNVTFSSDKDDGDLVRPLAAYLQFWGLAELEHELRRSSGVDEVTVFLNGIRMEPLQGTKKNSSSSTAGIVNNPQDSRSARVDENNNSPVPTLTAAHAGIAIGIAVGCVLAVVIVALAAGWRLSQDTPLPARQEQELLPQSQSPYLVYPPVLVGGTGTSDQPSVLSNDVDDFVILGTIADEAVDSSLDGSYSMNVSALYDASRLDHVIDHAKRIQRSEDNAVASDKSRSPARRSGVASKRCRRKSAGV